MEVPPTIRNAVRNFRLSRTSRDKVDILDRLFASPTIWIVQARECHSFVEHMADLAQPESIKDFTPGSYDIILWELAVTYLSYLVHETEYTDPPHAHARKLDSEMMYQFIQMTNSIMKMRHKLPFLDPERHELRYHIARVGSQVETEGCRQDNHRMLSQLADSSLHGLKLLLWAAEPGGKPGTMGMLSAANYFGLYSQTERLREGKDLVPATKVPIFPDEPPKTSISVCRALLRKGEDNDAEAYTTIHVASKLVAEHPWDFLRAEIVEHIVHVLWTRLETSRGGMPAWRFAAAGVSFFHAVSEAYGRCIGTEESNLWPSSIMQMMLQQGFFALIRRLVYILLPKDNYTDADAMHKQIILHQLTMLLSMICKLSTVPPPAYADQFIRLTWLKDTDAFRAVIRDIPAGAEKLLVAAWEELGLEHGFDEQKMRCQQEKDQSLEGVVGCSWHRCVLHNQVPNIKRIMLQEEPRCGKVQYCSEICQSRDWIDGAHSQVCLLPEKGSERRKFVMVGAKASDFIWIAPDVDLVFVESEFV